MSTNRFFVSLDDKGQPLAQRNTVKAKPYLSASFHGDSFSSSPPNGAYPRKVIEVAKAIEWVARATLPDGKKRSTGSKSGPVGRHLIRYTMIRVLTAPLDTLPERQQREAWTNQSADAFIAECNRSRSTLRFELVDYSPGTLEIRNWPSAGDSVVLPDVVRK